MQSISHWLQSNSTTNSYNPYKHTDPSLLRILLCHLLGKSSAWLYSHPDHELSTAEINQLNHWQKQLRDGLPMAYITGEQAFWDLSLNVTGDTLIPRPDTEIILETVIELFNVSKPLNILDLGTGTGALALALSNIYPQANITAVDRSEAALKVARLNAKQNGINHVSFLLSNWFQKIPRKKFELIVSNPPYISENDEHLADLKHEPLSALVADKEGLGDFIRIANQAKQFLAPGGLLVFEHGWEQKNHVHTILKHAGFVHISSRKDLAGHDRVSFGYN